MREPLNIWNDMPAWAKQILAAVAEERDVGRLDILSDSRIKATVQARHETWRRARAQHPRLSSKRLSQVFGHDSSSIRYALRELAKGPRAERRGRRGRPRVRHVKRGTVYTVLGKALLQTGVPITDDAELVVYQGEDGQLWARPALEFEDGRFEKVA